MEMDFQDTPYCLAISTRLVKAAASFTAMSASILRLMSMLCFFRPLRRRVDESGAMLWVLINLGISAVVLLSVNMLEGRQKKAAMK